uniref:Cysteine sulfinic acid decarboxylase n=1 Tax=Acanthochromis polyacanthus TaxID=80966 RepID=A0A3Q1EHP8_9TELE
DDVPLNGPTLDGLAAEEFIHQSMAIIIEDIVKKATDVKEKVCEWRSPDQLKELLDLELRDGGESDSKILQRCRDAIRYSVKTSHPRFFNQLYAGMEPYSMVASFIAEALKPSLYTYEVAPVFTLMEDAVLRKMKELIGWEEGGDGIFNPGGSMSNMYAMNLARYNHSPDIKELGLSAAPRLVVFTSQEVGLISQQLYWELELRTSMWFHLIRGRAPHTYFPDILVLSQDIRGNVLE